MTEKTHLPWWQETLFMVAAALLLSLILKTFFVQAFYIPSESMEPTLVIDDKVLVQKVSYWSGGPERGDIVVFRDSAGWLSPAEANEDLGIFRKSLETIGLYPSGGHLIKRVIGVGGDEVACCNEQNQITVNGVGIAEPYLQDADAQANTTFHTKVPDGYLWVQGDNRANSADSRAHMGQAGGGFVPTDQVVGKAWFRIWPFNRMGTLPATDAFNKVDP